MSARKTPLLDHTLLDDFAILDPSSREPFIPKISLNRQAIRINFEDEILAYLRSHISQNHLRVV